MTQFFNRADEKEKRRLLRKSLPKAELIVWSKLKGKQILGQKFRRQYSVGAFVIDFYCPALKLAVEIDGDSHFQEEVADYDRLRQAFVESFGIRFLRFTNKDVFNDLPSVLEAVRCLAQELGGENDPL